ASRITAPTASYCSRISGVHAVDGIAESRLSQPFFWASDKEFRMGRSGAQVGSSVTIVTGPVSFALATSDTALPSSGVRDVGSTSPSLPTTNTVAATVTPTTASSATTPSAHFQPFPRFGGGPGGGHG